MKTLTNMYEIKLQTTSSIAAVMTVSTTKYRYEYHESTKNSLTFLLTLASPLLEELSTRSGSETRAMGALG